MYQEAINTVQCSQHLSSVGDRPTQNSMTYLIVCSEVTAIEKSQRQRFGWLSWKNISDEAVIVEWLELTWKKSAYQFRVLDTLKLNSWYKFLHQE